MAVVDPYALCPCGSGQKFKWCCQKVEGVAERAQRLFDGNQVSAALEVLDEGLKKDPHNAWLLTRKAIYLIRRNEPEAAKEPLRRVLETNPKHVVTLILLTRLALETEGPMAGVALYQRALSALDRDERKGLASMARIVGSFLGEMGHHPAALKHLELEQVLAPDPEAKGRSVTGVIERDPEVSPWMKNPYRLAPPPEGSTAEARARFDEAMAWADEGLWSSAAAAFERLAADPKSGPAADHNLGLCRLWLADNAAASGALRRAIARMGRTSDAVDLEALCQEITPVGPDDLADQVQWIWPLRDRDGLTGKLRDDPLIHEEEPGPLDDEEPDSPVVEQFLLLDRPAVEARRGLTPRDIPRIVGQVLVGQESVVLETYDDGRLDALAERFTALAGATIAPAHPKTKVLGTVARSTLAVIWERLFPEGLEPDEILRLNREQGIRSINEVWPATPMPYLGGRTPLAAAAAGDAEVPLRAAVMHLEQSHEAWRESFDANAFRAMLKIGPEPAIDPEAVDPERLHLARFGLVPADRLSDERLVAFYRRAKRMMLVEALEAATRTLIDRPATAEGAGIEPLTLYSDLVVLTAGRGRFPEAFDWLRRGRQADAPPSRARNAPLWDMMEIRLKTRTEAPETWVPELAVVMDRYGNDQDANQTIVMSLIDMGLIRMVPGSDKPDDVMIDPRPLQVLMAEYGPRLTTASGQLGVAATKGGIWTPGSSTGGGGSVWTPGAGTGASAGAAPTAATPGHGGEKPKLIIPGR